MTTINDERDRLENAKWEKNGTICKCCNQTVKGYNRRISSVMSIFLARLIQKTKKGNYIHYTQVTKNTTDYSKLKDWKLIEAMPNDTDKKSSGKWRATEKGKSFINTEISQAKKKETT